MIRLLVVLVLRRIGAFLGNGYGIQRQIYVILLWESEISAGFHDKNFILGIWCFRLTTMASMSTFHVSCPISFPGIGEYGFGFKFWYGKPSVKNQWERDRRLNFVIFVVWFALIIGGLVLLAWGRKSCLKLALKSDLLRSWFKQQRKICYILFS